MPLFEYRCTDCGSEFEEICSLSETPHCPKCKSEHTVRLLSACSHCSADGGALPDAPRASSGGGCSGCAGGHCASCHH